MLRGDNPTHPEYLAMMQCIDERRDEKMRTHELEYKYNTDAMQRWAVARRTQILTQFYQGVRESRVKILEELGQQWYEIQQERRRHANSVPDYGIRFPTSKTEQKKQAVAYNKEVSILSGIARHKGFPAAPEMKGASAGDIEDDLDAINVSSYALPATFIDWKLTRPLPESASGEPASCCDDPASLPGLWRPVFWPQSRSCR